MAEAEVEETTKVVAKAEEITITSKEKVKKVILIETKSDSNKEKTLSLILLRELKQTS